MSLLLVFVVVQGGVRMKVSIAEQRLAKQLRQLDVDAGCVKQMGIGGLVANGQAGKFTSAPGTWRSYIPEARALLRQDPSKP